MLKPRKKITKKELKQDKFVIYTIKAKEYIENNSRRIMWMAIGILALILAVSFISRSKKTANLEASILFSEASLAMEQGNIQQGESQIKQLIDNYQGVEAAGQGCFFLAKYYWQQSELPNAKIYFKQYLDDYKDDPLFTAAAYAGYADCLYSEGDTLGAAHNYEQAARAVKESPLTPAYLYSAARAYMEASDFSKARKLASEIVDRFEDNTIKNDAEILLNMIKLKS
jgi:predicted negative regulator of RcsB-dependent stress response